MTTTNTAGAIVHADGEGEHRWFHGGGLHIWKARGEETGGAFHAFVDHLTKGKMTPLHLHPNADDSMYVIEGEILYLADGVEHRLGPGSFATSLRGTPHAFMVTSETARIFTFQTPGNDHFYLEGSEPADPDAVDDGRFDVDKVKAAAANNPDDVVFLGPPPFAPPA